MSHANGHRWSKFWWQDWAGDAGLRSCSLAARGLWMALLCIMHEATPRGYLLLDGEPPTAKQLAAITGATLKELATLLAELRAARVYSIDPVGWIYSRRMVKDAIASEKGYETGKRGGNPQLLHKTNGKGADDPPHPRQGVKATLNPNRYPDPYPLPLTEPLTAPVNPESDSEVQSEPEKEERKVLKLPTLEKKLARARTENPSPDSLSELMAEAKIPQPEGKLDPNAITAAHVRMVTKACSMRIPYGEVRSVEAQTDALLSQPAVAGADVTMGLKWQPHEAERSVEEQIAAALADSTPEQIERARRYSR
jgi:hypothetical protein